MIRNFCSTASKNAKTHGATLWKIIDGCGSPETDRVDARGAALVDKIDLAVDSKDFKVNRETWRRDESGKVGLRVSTADRLAAYLGLTLYPADHCCTDAKPKKPKRS